MRTCTNNNMSESDEEKVNYQELLFRYIIHWPWFLASYIDLFDRRLGIFIFSDSCVSGFCFYYDKG